MKTPSFVRITLRASKLQVRYREHVITNSYGELFQQPSVQAWATALPTFGLVHGVRFRGLRPYLSKKLYNLNYIIQQPKIALATGQSVSSITVRFLVYSYVPPRTLGETLDQVVAPSINGALYQWDVLFTKSTMLAPPLKRS